MYTLVGVYGIKLRIIGSIGTGFINRRKLAAGSASSHQLAPPFIRGILLQTRIDVFGHISPAA